jgi:hypothetical protein
VASVVDDDIQAASLGQDRLDRVVAGRLGRNVELHGTQIDMVLGGVLLRRATCGALRPALSRIPA